MPVLERCFYSADLGRRWTALEGVPPSSLGSRPGCQQGPLPWDLPEMIRMVKLVWKSQSELQATKQRGILENEDVLHSFPGKQTVRCIKSEADLVAKQCFPVLGGKFDLSEAGQEGKVNRVSQGPRAVIEECLSGYENAP